MATNTNHTAPQSNTHATTETHASPEPGKLEATPDKTKTFVYVLFMLAGPILAGLALFGATQASDSSLVKYLFPGRMGIIMGIYIAVIMIYPLIVAFRSRQHFMLRLLIVIGSVVYAVGALPIQVRIPLFQEIESQLWRVPIVGPVFAIIAVILPAYAAVSILTSAPKGLDTRKQDKESADDLAERIRTFKREYDEAEAESIANRGAEGKAKTTSEDLDRIDKENKDKHDDALKALNETAAVKREAKLKRDETTNDQAIDGIVAALALKDQNLQTANKGLNKSLQMQLQSECDELSERLNKLRTTSNSLKRSLAAVRVKIKNSPEQKAKDAAFKLSTQASKSAKIAQKAYKTADEAATEADRVFGVKADKLTLAQQERDATHAHAAATTQSVAAKFRDSAWYLLMPIFATVCLCGVLYGWILVEFH